MPQYGVEESLTPFMAALDSCRYLLGSFRVPQGLLEHREDTLRLWSSWLVSL